MASNLPTAGIGRTAAGGFLAAAGMGRQLKVDLEAEIRGSTFRIEGVPIITGDLANVPPMTGAMRITLGIKVTGEGTATNEEEAMRLVLETIGQGTAEATLTIDLGTGAEATDLEIYTERKVRLGVADETTLDERTRRLREDDEDIILLLEPGRRQATGKERT